MKRRLKRILSILLVLTVLALSSPAANAQSLPQRIYAASISEGYEKVPDSIDAKAALLMDVETGKILMGKDIDKKLYPASVTKIMTMLLTMEAIEQKKISFDDRVTVSSLAAGKGGSQIWLKENETMTVHELLKATAVYSANDACTALGEHIAGSDSAFTELLNSRAKELGMKNTHFDNCTGLDDETTTHLTTARDVAIMARELLKHEKIIEYTTIWMDSLRNGETQLVNTNKLVRYYKGATGLKTGTTSKAGCCVAASARREETHLLAVVLGSSSSKERFSAARQMLDWGFANYKTIALQIDKKLITQVRVINGVEDSLTPEISKSFVMTVKKGDEKKIETKIELPLDVKAPVEENQKLGDVVLMIGKNEIGRYSLTSPRSVRSLNFKDILFRLIKSIA